MGDVDDIDDEGEVDKGVAEACGVMSAASAAAIWACERPGLKAGVCCCCMLLPRGICWLASLGLSLLLECFELCCSSSFGIFFIGNVAVVLLVL